MASGRSFAACAALSSVPAPRWNLHGANTTQIVQWFDLGGEIQLSDNAGAQEVLDGLKQIQGLMDKIGKLNVHAKDGAEVQVSAAEFILEGLHAHKKIGRNEERVFTAGEKQPKIAERPAFEDEEPGVGRKRSFN